MAIKAGLPALDTQAQAQTQAQTQTQAHAQGERFDSLEFGPVSRGLLLGPPLFVLYPWKHFGPYVSVLPPPPAAARSRS